MPDQTRHDYYNRRFSSMINERQSFINHYTELSDFVQPRRGRFFISDRNKGEKKHNNIINSTAGQALRTARSGMLAGTMSPSRPWFDLETPDPGMMEIQSVKEWLAKVERIMREVLTQSNFYGQSSTMLSELLLFGTGCMIHVNDFEDVARFYTQTVGNYMVAQNSRMEVDTLGREFEWSVYQVVQEFGLDKVSTFVRNSWDRGNYGTWVPLRHFVEPNVDSKSRPILATDKPFSSVYYEPGNTGPDKNKTLSESGFDMFPAYVPRWETTVEDIYGTDCPGMIALGDVKSLQREEREKGKAIEKMVSPPLSGPPSLRNVPVNSLPGGLTVYQGANGSDQSLKPIYQVTAPLNELRADMVEIERRINRAFFVDMFLAISNIEGIQPRNQLDIASRNEERLLQLGPVLERLHGEFLDPVINRIFIQMTEANILPPIPDELQGIELKVKFVSNLAIAQRAVETADLDRILAASSNAASIDPSAALKFNGPQYVDEYARAIGSAPSVIRTDEEVEAILQQQQQQAASQASAEQANQMAQAGKALGDIQTGPEKGDNIVADIAEAANGN